MDDIELKHALQSYVSSDEPPFDLTAEALLTQGRRRQRWRLGMSLGAGSTAAAVTIAGTLVLGPFGADSGPPVLDSANCGQVWRIVYSPPASPSPTGAYRSPEGISPTRDFDFSSADPSPAHSAEATSSPLASNFPDTTASPRASDAPQPTGSPWPTPFPGLSFYRESTVERTAGLTEANAMVCHLAAEIERVFPGSTITGIYPMTVTSYGDNLDQVWTISTGFSFRQGGKELRIDTFVQPVFGFDRSAFEGLTCQTRETQHTAIRACSTGEVTREQLAELISGPELELYG